MTELNIITKNLSNMMEGIDDALQSVADFDSEGDETKDELLTETENHLENAKSSLDEAITELDELSTKK